MTHTPKWIDDNRSTSQLPLGEGFLADNYLWELSGGYNPYTHEGSLREKTLDKLHHSAAPQPPAMVTRYIVVTTASPDSVKSYLDSYTREVKRTFVEDRSRPEAAMILEVESTTERDVVFRAQNMVDRLFSGLHGAQLHLDIESATAAYARHIDFLTGVTV